MGSTAMESRIIKYIHLLLFLFIPLIWLALLSILKLPITIWLLAVGEIIISSYFLFVRPRLFIPSLFFALLLLSVYLPLPQKLWMVNILIIILFMAILMLAIKPLRKLIPGIPQGNINFKIIAFMIFTVIISSTALFIWVNATNPDLSFFIETAKPFKGILIIGAIIGFPIFNSLAEELIFRWFLWDGFETLTLKPALIIVIQAIIFGLSHYNGFPNGWSGIGLAAIYGLMLGYIRHSSKGLAAPIITHIFADLTIIIIVFRTAGMI